MAALRACCSRWAGPGVGLRPGTQRIERLLRRERVGPQDGLWDPGGSMLKDSRWHQLRQEPLGRPDVSHPGIFGFC